MLPSLTGNSDRDLLLLTGGSGLLGSGLIPHLRKRKPDRQIIVLTRRPEAVSESPGITAVRADLTRSNLGLEEGLTDTLRSRVTEIIHSAADVRFNSTREHARLVNTEGTRRVLDFAEQCPGLQKMAHVSTLYVAGYRPGLVAEQELRHDYGYLNAYEESKHEAEHLVFERIRSLPISVYRPSAIIGNSITGKCSQKNFFHTLIALVPHASRLPCLPFDPAAAVDLIADDWCSGSLAFLFDLHFRPGGTRHLCAGTEFSLTAGELIDMAFRVIQEQTRMRIVQPPVGSWSDLQREIAFCRSGTERRLLDSISSFLPHLAIYQPFDRGATGDILAKQNFLPPPPYDFVERVIRSTLIG